MFWQLIKAQLFLFYCILSLAAQDHLSLITLPADLDPSIGFDVLETSKPKLSIQWTDPSQTLILPYREGSHISIQQNDKLWNLITKSAAESEQKEIFKLLYHIASKSDDPKWHQIPLGRKVLLFMLCLPFALLCYNAKHLSHYFVLAFLVLLIFFSPNYQHKLILHSNHTWEISPFKFANWIKWENQPLIGWRVSQSELPLSKLKPSEFGNWIAPQFKQLGQIDLLWSSQHHVKTL